MPRYTFSGSQTFTARAYALGPDDELDILAGAVMTGQYGDGALITVTGGTIVNSGTISNTGTVIQMNGATLINRGTISAYLPIAASALVIQSAPDRWNYIFNDGTISYQQQYNIGSAISFSAGKLAINNSGTMQLQLSGNVASPMISADSGTTVQLLNDGMINAGGSPTLPNTVLSVIDGHVLNNKSILGGLAMSSGDLYNKGLVQGPVVAHAVENYGTIQLANLWISLTIMSFTTSNDSLINDGNIGGIVDLGAGDDVVFNTHGTIAGTLNLGEGNDSYQSIDGLSLSIIGGAGDDSISGGSNVDTIYGDNVSGDTSGGNDVLFGNGGADVIHGGYGDDLIAGNQDADTLYGDQGNDLVYGGRGNDTIYGGDGADIIYGDLGDDQLYGEGGSDTFVFAPGLGHDKINAFGTAAGNYDVIRFKAGTLDNYADVQAHMIQQGANVVILVGISDDITVLTTTIAALTADHFLFG